MRVCSQNWLDRRCREAGRQNGECDGCIVQRGETLTVDETHPYMLFLQRWWLTGQAVYRGYNVLSLDTDLHLAVNPLKLLNGVAYAPAPPSIASDGLRWPLIASSDL